MTLEPFIQLNHNAYLHSTNAFDGKPQRIRDIKADFDGGVAEPWAKATRRKGRSTMRCQRRTRKSCLRRCAVCSARSLTRISAIGPATPAAHRGYANTRGGLGAEPIAGDPVGLHDILTSRLWRACRVSCSTISDHHVPAGRRMGRIGEAFARQIPDRIRYGAKVVAIRQNDSGVAVEFEDLAAGGRCGKCGPTGACARSR